MPSEFNSSEPNPFEPKRKNHARLLTEHVDFLLHLARKLGKRASFMTPFPKLSLKELEAEVEEYNDDNSHSPVSTRQLKQQYELLREACDRDGGPLMIRNSSKVTIKDVIEQSLKHINKEEQRASKKGDDNQPEPKDYWI